MKNFTQADLRELAEALRGSGQLPELIAHIAIQDGLEVCEDGWKDLEAAAVIKTQVYEDFFEGPDFLNLIEEEIGKHIKKYRKEAKESQHARK
jgi:hypothetical protein